MPQNENSNSLSDNIAYISNQNVFHSEMFGFKRDEVLACIERISNENLTRQKQLEINIEELKRRLHNAEQDNSTLLLKTKQVCDQLKNEQARAEQAVQEIAQLRLQTENAAGEMSSLRLQLAEKEREVLSLKADNARLNKTVNSLTQSVTEYESQQSVLKEKVELARAEADSAVAAARQRVEAAKREAEAQSMVIKAKAEDEARILTAKARQEKTDSKKMISEAADNIAASIVVLKSQLAAVDEKLLAATGNLQKATGCIQAALGNTEKDLVTLGVQMEKFPTPLPPVAPSSQPQQDVMSAPAAVINYSSNPAQRDTVHAYQRAAYTQQNDAYDAGREAYEMQQRAAYEAQQRAAYEAQQRIAYEQQQAYERAQREAYERAQREAYERAQREAYERAQREAYERAQREAYERAQQEAYERRMQAEFEQRQRDMYERMQREAYEAQQRAAYKPPYQPYAAQYQPYTAQPQYVQAPPYTAQPAPAYYQPAPQYQSVPQETAPINSAYVPRPAPIAPAPVDNYSQPPQQQREQVIREEPLATYTPTRSDAQVSQTHPHSMGDVYEAQSAPEFTQQVTQPPVRSPFAPPQQSNPNITRQEPHEEMPEPKRKEPDLPVPQPEPVPEPAPIAPEPVAQQAAPFAQQQAFSAPKGMHYQPPRRMVQVRRTQQAKQQSKPSLSDTIIDGLSNMLK